MGRRKHKTRRREKMTTSDPPATQAEDNADNQAESPKQDILPTPIAKVDIPPSHASYKITCDKKRDGWDIAKLIAEFIGLAFLIAYTVFAGQQVYQMKRTNKISSDSLEAQTRPWIDIDPNIVITNQDSRNFRFKFKIRNYGHSPAILGRTRFFFVEEQGIARITMFNDNPACVEPAKDLSYENFRRVTETIFPKSDGVWEEREGSAQAKPPAKTEGRNMMIGCLAYIGGSGGGIHYTQILFDAPSMPQQESTGEIYRLINSLVLRYTDYR